MIRQLMTQLILMVDAKLMAQARLAAAPSRPAHLRVPPSSHRDAALPNGEDESVAITCFNVMNDDDIITYNWLVVSKPPLINMSKPTNHLIILGKQTKERLKPPTRQGL